jgi:hypothetical protein
MAKKAARKASPKKSGRGKKAGSGKRAGKRPIARKKGAGAKKAGPARAAGKRASASKRAGARKATRGKTAPKKAAAKRTAARRRPKAGGTGRESTLAQTPRAGRTVKGRTNPMPTKRSTGTPAGAGDSRRSPALDRERRQLREVEEGVPTPPSSLDPDRIHPSAARSGRSAFQQARREHNETSPVLTGGDVDADWEDAYSVGDEAPGGDNPTPDQDRVDDIGRAMGVEYADNEELKASDKISERDKHRWELDPASAEDYPDHEED